MSSGGWKSTWLVLLMAIAVCAHGAETRDDNESDKEEPFSDFDRGHWSFQTPELPPVPQFTDPEDQRWVRNPVDAFILAQLKAAGLRPAPQADRRTLARRLAFRLTGLPPSPESVEAFDNDHAPQAYERLVDRLLASPGYGERWAQHWLDVVRYAETEGFEYDTHRPHVWAYRDYVIDAWNNDKPYDQFLREQLAGDELATPENRREPLVAAGFHRLGPVRRNAGNAKVAFSRNEILTEMTNAIGASMLGLTIGCARCHDHKYDPVRQSDYYRLQAFLAATHDDDISLAPADEQRRWQAKADAVDAEITRIKTALSSATGEKEQKLRAQLKAAKRRRPAPLPAIFSVKNDASRATAIHLLVRGEEDRKGRRMGMRVPGVFLPSDTAELPLETKHPKSVLARWVTDPNNPLTARVIVNRVWMAHFGNGIVSTPNDFGLNGDPPSHPLLLDYLARYLIDHGWSLKALQRLITGSSTYRQSSASPYHTQATDADPENRLLWHFARRRLQAEALRDAMLAVSGKLNRKRGGPSVIVPVDKELVALLYDPDQWQVTPDPREHDRRSIYLFAKRNLRLPFMEAFDQPDLQTSCARRESSTHAPQALEMLNGALANRLAASFADRLRRAAPGDAQRQVDLAFRLAAGRAPTKEELKLGVAFLADQPLKEFALAMFNTNAFLYVE